MGTMRCSRFPGLSCGRIGVPIGGPQHTPAAREAVDAMDDFAVPQARRLPAREDFGRMPFVSREAAASWPATRLWTADYLARSVADEDVRVQLSKDGAFGVRSGPIKLAGSALASVLRQRSPYIDGKRWYLQQTSISEGPFAGLRGDIPMIEAIDPAMLISQNLWVGPAGNATVLHFDISNNLFVQIAGQKRFSLFEPSATPRLAFGRPNTKAAHFSMFDVRAPDYDRFPAASGVRRYVCVLSAGDILYFPAFWPHFVETIQDSVSLNTWWRPDFAQCDPEMLRTLLSGNAYYYRIDSLRGKFNCGPIPELPRRLLDANAVGAAVVASGAVLIYALVKACHLAGITPEPRVNGESDLAAAVQRVRPGLPLGELEALQQQARQVRLRKGEMSAADAEALVSATERLAASCLADVLGPLREEEMS